MFGSVDRAYLLFCTARFISGMGLFLEVSVPPVESCRPANKADGPALAPKPHLEKNSDGGTQLLAAPRCLPLLAEYQNPSLTSWIYFYWQKRPGKPVYCCVVFPDVGKPGDSPSVSPNTPHPNVGAEKAGQQVTEINSRVDLRSGPV